MSLHDSSDGISEEVERQLQLAISAAALAARKVIAERHAALAVSPRAQQRSGRPAPRAA